MGDRRAVCAAWALLSREVEIEIMLWGGSAGAGRMGGTALDRGMCCAWSGGNLWTGTGSGGNGLRTGDRINRLLGRDAIELTFRTPPFVDPFEPTPAAN